MLARTLLMLLWLLWLAMVGGDSNDSGVAFDFKVAAQLGTMTLNARKEGPGKPWKRHGAKFSKVWQRLAKFNKD